jgi:hypothetical protein
MVNERKDIERNNSLEVMLADFIGPIVPIVKTYGSNGTSSVPNLIALPTRGIDLLSYSSGLYRQSHTTFGTLPFAFPPYLPYFLFIVWCIDLYIRKGSQTMRLFSVRTT